MRLIRRLAVTGASLGLAGNPSGRGPAAAAALGRRRPPRWGPACWTVQLAAAAAAGGLLAAPSTGDSAAAATALLASSSQAQVHAPLSLLHEEREARLDSERRLEHLSRRMIALEAALVHHQARPHARAAHRGSRATIASRLQLSGPSGGGSTSGGSAGSPLVPHGRAAAPATLGSSGASPSSSRALRSPARDSRPSRAFWHAGPVVAVPSWAAPAPPPQPCARPVRSVRLAVSAVDAAAAGSTSPHPHQHASPLSRHSNGSPPLLPAAGAGAAAAAALAAASSLSARGVRGVGSSPYGRYDDEGDGHDDDDDEVEEEEARRRRRDGPRRRADRRSRRFGA